MSIPIFNDETKEHPTYLLVVNQSKLDKFLNRFTYFLRRRMLIQNNIHLMLDNYDYNSKKEGKHLNCLLCKKQVDNINKLYI
jgi:hypothetical protein